MVQYYLDDPTNAKLNIGKSEPRASFARFACVGLDSADVNTDSLRYLEQFAGALKEVTKESKQTVPAIWKNIRDLRSASGSLPFPPRAKAGGTTTVVPSTEKMSPTEECEKQVLDTLASLPVPYDEVRRESIAAFVALAGAFDKLIGTAETVAKNLLAIEQRQARREAFRQLVLENSDSVRKALVALESDQFLNELLLRRRQAALFRPYESFIDMLNYNTVRDRVKVMTAGYAVDGYLSEFDGLRRGASPTDMVKAIRVGHGKLEKAAAGDGSPEDAFAYLRALSSELKRWSTDAQSLKTDLDSLRKAISDIQ